MSSAFIQYRFAFSLCSEASVYAKTETCIREHTFQTPAGSFEAGLTLLHPSSPQSEPDVLPEIRDLSLGPSRKCFKCQWYGCCISWCSLLCLTDKMPTSASSQE